MKVCVICTGKGSVVRSINNKDVVIYHVDFAVKKEINSHQQKFFGGVHLESIESFSYVEKREYDLMLSDSLSLVAPSDITEAGNLN